jgi:protein SCO1/2
VCASARHGGGGRRRYLSAASAASIALLAGCSFGGVSQALPAFTLTNQSGHVIRAEDLRGRAAIISFLFTNCHDTCPVVTARLVQAQADVRTAGLSSTIRFVSITVDPISDTPDVLRKYAERFRADTTNWDFLTGEPEEVGQVVRAMKVFTTNDRRVGHSDLVLFVNTRGEVEKRATGIDLQPPYILEWVRRAPRTNPTPKA